MAPPSGAATTPARPSAATARWQLLRASVSASLRAESPLAAVVRLGEIDGRTVEVDRICADELSDTRTEAIGARRARMVHPEGLAVELVLPREHPTPSAESCRAILSAMWELYELTPAHTGRVVVDRGVVVYQCVHGAAWRAWAGWGELLERAQSRQGQQIVRGVSMTSMPVYANGDDEEGALLLTLTRVLTPRLDALASLSPSQREVVELAASGATLGEIAKARGSSIETVRTQLKEAYRRLGISSRAELAGVVARGASRSGVMRRG